MRVREIGIRLYLFNVFYPSKLLFPGFLQFIGNFFTWSKYLPLIMILRLSYFKILTPDTVQIPLFYLYLRGQEDSIQCIY